MIPSTLWARAGKRQASLSKGPLVQCYSDCVHPLRSAAERAIAQYSLRTSSPLFIPSKLQSQQIRTYTSTVENSTNHYLDSQFSTVNEALRKRLQVAFPHFQSPTLAQALLWQIIGKPADVLLRAHTGSGKSLGVLVALLNQHTDLYDSAQNGKEHEGTLQRTSSIVIVPTRPLALQYAYWAEQLAPLASKQMPPDSIVQVVHDRLPINVSPLHFFQDRPNPRIRIFTATALHSILKRASTAMSSQTDDMIKIKQALNVGSLQTLVLDEADAMLALPGRFAVEERKTKKNKPKHIEPIIEVMNFLMSERRTFSASTEQVRTEPRQRQWSSAEPFVHDQTLYKNRAWQLQRLRKLDPRQPLQLVVLGASANSVMRRFLAVTTGWLRTGGNDESESIQRTERGKWLDLTGMTHLSKCAREMQDIPEITHLLHDNASAETEGESNGMESSPSTPMQLPREITHCCVVVDSRETKRSKGGRAKQTPTYKMQNLDIDGREEYKREGGEISVRRPRERLDLGQEDVTPSIDVGLLQSLAYLWATMAVRKGLAIIQDTESVLKTIDVLRALDIPAVNTDEANMNRDSHVVKHSLVASGADKDEEADVLHVVKRSNVRGIDIAGGISHVFIVGFEAANDAPTYVHLAGRVSRFNAAFNTRKELQGQRPPGTVVTLLRGIERSAEMKGFLRKGFCSVHEERMAGVFKSLDITLQHVKPLDFGNDGVGSIMQEDDDVESNINEDGYVVSQDDADDDLFMEEEDITSQTSPQTPLREQPQPSKKSNSLRDPSSSFQSSDRVPRKKRWKQSQKKAARKAASEAQQDTVHA